MTIIPNGYKKTKVGIIPDNWSVTSLGNIATIDKNSLSANTSQDFSFEYISLSDVKIGRINEKLQKYNFANAPSRARRIVKKGDILFSTVRPNLRGFAHYKRDNEVICSTGFSVIRNKKESVQSYIYQNLFSLNIEKQLFSLVVGSNYPAINSSDVKNLKLPFPSILEQEKIAMILNLWDRGIENQKKLITEKNNYKRGIIQKIFSQEIKFKDRYNNSFNKWEKRKFSDILKEHSLKSTGVEKVFSVSVHKGLVNQIEHLGRSYSASDTSKYNLVKPNDIVYTKSPTGDFPYGIIKQAHVDKNVIVSPLYGIFTPETEYLGYMLNVYFESNINVYNYLHSIVQKGAKNTINITNKTFLSKSLLLPTSKEEQRKISELFSCIDKEIRLLEDELIEFKKQKKALMEKLLTGEVRVKV